MSRFPGDVETFFDLFLIPSRLGRGDRKEWWPAANVAETKGSVDRRIKIKAD